jgi:hypothetical protein
LIATPPLKVDALVLEEVYPTIEIATRNRMENYLGAFGRMLTPLLFESIAVAAWRFRFAIASGRSHCQRRVPGAHHERQKRSKHPTIRHSDAG